MTARSPLIDQVLAGSSRELQLLAAQGMLPVPFEELVPLQVHLAETSGSDISGWAEQSLTEVDPRLAAPFLAQDAKAPVLSYFARRHANPLLVAAVLRRRDVSRDLLVEVASQLDPELQEILLLRQDAIVERPDVLVALEKNPRLSIYARRRILEYREHLLPRERPVRVVEAETPEWAKEAELSPEELDLIARARAAAPSGDVDDRTGLSDGQVRSLPVPTRMKLSRGASRTLRGILVKDQNAMVAVSVIVNCALSDEEIEQVAGSRSVVEEVLAAIARRREWASKYNIALALVRNPRTSVGVSLRMLSRVGVRDLKILARDRNIPEAVRSSAGRLYKIKAQ